MSHQTWRVLGATGFTGSAIMARLGEEGVSASPVAAPRLATSTTSPAQLIDEARRLESVIDYLADSFAGADVVVNCAGLAAPDRQDRRALVGANALLPAVVAIAAQRTGVERVIMLSSAAVQGNRPVLDASPDTAPFSEYSYSKSLGEDCVLRLRDFIRETASAGAAPGSPKSRFPAAPSTAPAEVSPHHVAELCVVRATSVQGPGRRTTSRFARFASSPLASVAGRGEARTPVTSVQALAEFVVAVGRHDGELPGVVLQPWEGATTASVIRDAGRREPRHLPAPVAHALLRAGWAASTLAGGRLDGAVRRAELTWFGQDQDDSWTLAHGLVPRPRIGGVLRQAHLEGEA